MYPRTFLVSAPRFKLRWIVLAMLGWSAVCVGAFIALKDHFPAKGPAFDAAFAVGRSLAIVVYMAFLAIALWPRKMALVLTRDRLTIDDGRGGVFPHSGARLGTWNVAYYGTTQGTALHLSNGKRRYVLGGQDHRLSPTVRCDIGAVESVDAYVPAAEFAAILALMPGFAQCSPPLEASRCAGPALIRCPLVPNRATAMATLSAIMPWFVSMAFLAVLGGCLGALGVFDSYQGQIAFAVLAVVLFVGGIAVTVVRSMRTPQSTLAIELDVHDARVIDVRSNRILAAAPFSQISATPAEHRCNGRTSYSVPVLVLVIPGSPAITLGIYDFRFAWQGKVRRQDAPKYVVGGADWLALVEALGLRRLLDVHAT